jgi:AraC-like DNA-binding protein
MYLPNNKIVKNGQNDALVMLEMQFIKPSLPLQSFIQYYFIYNLDSCSLKTHYPDGMAILPNTYGRIGIFFSKPSFKKEDNGSEILNPLIGVSGFYSKPRLYSSESDLCMLIIGFKPTGLQRLFDFSVSEITNQNLSLSDIFPVDHEELLNRMSDKIQWNRRIEIVESFLLKKLEAKNTFSEIDQIIDLIFKVEGAKPIGEIASQYYLSNRTFRRRFIEGMGISPKLFSKIVRFQRGLKLMSDIPHLSLTEIAYRLGYFDQAHFIHEFSELYGSSPKNFIRTRRSILGKYYDDSYRRSSNVNVAYI